MKFTVDTESHRIEVHSSMTRVDSFTVQYDNGSPIATAARLLEKLLKVHERYSHTNSPTAGRTR